MRTWTRILCKEMGLQRPSPFQSSPALNTTLFCLGVIAFVWLLSACQPAASFAAETTQIPPPTEDEPGDPIAEAPGGTPFPTRPLYEPGELVEYIAQPGDTLPALAAHFNTTEAEILAANPVIPDDVSTLPPGLPLQVPIYYRPFWGSPFKIIPDSLFVNGPSEIDYDLETFIDQQPGWLSSYREYAAGRNRSGAELVELVAQNFSISPRLLVALLEYQALATSLSAPNAALLRYPLGFEDRAQRGVYLQMVAAANLLNNGYYQWRSGSLTVLELADRTIEHPDPWQNAATVALQYYFSHLLPPESYARAISPDGFARTYRQLFGDPWALNQPHIQGSLQQPTFTLPFERGTAWTLTGGPHTGWGEGDPLTALDFAPPAAVGGCSPSDEWVTAVAPGVIARSEPAIVVLDTDGDGDERSGWVVFYFHMGTEGQVTVGTQVQTSDPLGHPSCEGGRATGTHIHIARKYNGEWIPADGALPFNLDGWIAEAGSEPYQGRMRRFGQVVEACVCSNQSSLIRAQAP